MERLEFDELDKLSEQKEVFAPDAAFEAPVKNIGKGHLFMAVEEVMPEIGATDLEVRGEIAESKGKGYPIARRDVMRLFSASAILGATACVKRPAEKIVPYVNQPVDFVPGNPVYYATTCNECPAACGVVVKTREGRPTKLEGGPEHPVSQGALCAIGQASIQGLYHPERHKSPLIQTNGLTKEFSWEAAFDRIGAIVKGTKKVGIITKGSTGSQRKFYAEFLTKIGSKSENVFTWDANGLYSSISEAHRLAFGVEGLPRLELARASTIVGIGSDILDVGTSVVYHSKGLSQALSIKGIEKGELVQFEAVMSLTGGRADKRHVIPVGSELATTLLLVRSLHEQSTAKGSKGAKAVIASVLDANKAALDQAYDVVGVKKEVFEALARKMLEKPSVLVAGGTASFDENATSLQVAGIFANILLGAYGSILNFDKGWSASPVKAGDMKRFMEASADLDVVFVIGTDPSFTLPASYGFSEALTKVKTVVSIQNFPAEVDRLAEFILPADHYLETWGDEEPVSGFLSIRQPAVRTTVNSRQPEEMLMWIAASAGSPMGYADYRTYLSAQWKSYYEMAGAKVDYETFVKAVLRRGFIGKLDTRTVGDLKDVKISLALPESGLKLVSPFDHRLRDGSFAHIPILQEVGDGMTTIAWDSWVAINPNTCRKLGLKRNDVIRVEGPGGFFEGAIFPLPGLHPDAIVAPRGNGHTDKRSTISNGVGFNPLAAFAKAEDKVTGQPVTSGQTVKVSLVGKTYRLAAMQKHHDIGNRSDIVRTTSLAALAKESGDKDLDTVPDLYPDVLHRGDYRWGMSVDLSKCTGCGACMTACSLENNVAQIGREQILMGREMHWIRLDRYFNGEVDSPGVTFQPMMCQQCNHAPCEAVCPVLATTHDDEGINAMTYNRCVGTRYCGNACPYKVRRFNWWTYKWNTMGEKERDRNIRALNPDVTVRTRGVMEKCNFCVGRLRDAKLSAKERSKEFGREFRVQDSDVKTACQQTCPSDAITFGDLKNPGSGISKLRRDPRAYLVLGGFPEEKEYGLKTLPNVSYLMKVGADHESVAGSEGTHAPEHG
ncbi:MAG: 4Fe-4S dicluster domain-containing protein [Pseudomonadota bacterium]